MICSGIIWLYNGNFHEDNIMCFGYLEKLLRDEKILEGRSDNLTTDSKVLLCTQYMWLTTTLKKCDRQYLIDSKVFCQST